MCAVVIMFVLASALAQSTTVQTSTAEKNANVTLVVKGAQGGIKGPDGKTHSAFIPCNFTVYVGQTVNLTVINYDNEQHTFTSPELGVNFFIPERISPSAPSVSHFQFTPTKAGIFRWWCAIKCDTAAGEWAMTTGKDGGTGQLGFMAGYVTVLTS
jgi:plastocyanin